MRPSDVVHASPTSFEIPVGAFGLATGAVVDEHAAASNVPINSRKRFIVTPLASSYTDAHHLSVIERYFKGDEDGLEPQTSRGSPERSTKLSYPSRTQPELLPTGHETSEPPWERASPRSQKLERSSRVNRRSPCAPTPFGISHSLSLHMQSTGPISFTGYEPGREASPQGRGCQARR